MEINKFIFRDNNTDPDNNISREGVAIVAMVRKPRDFDLWLNILQYLVYLDYIT